MQFGFHGMDIYIFIFLKANFQLGALARVGRVSSTIGASLSDTAFSPLNPIRSDGQSESHRYGRYGRAV